MLMALLSGLTALCAPEQALAAQDHASQVEAGSSADSDVQTPAYGVAFGLPNAPIKAETPRSGAFSSPVAAPRVAIGVDRARE